MDMEVMIPSPPDFFFDSSTSTPYISAPSSPQRPGNFFYSAPTSPSRISAFYHDAASPSLSAVPFHWEERPGLPKSHVSTAASSTYGDAEEDDLHDSDFAFDFSGQFETDSLHADELFERGKIKPLKPPPRFLYDPNHRPNESSPKSPKRMITKAFSPRARAKKPEPDPFAEALEQSRNDTVPERGRGRNPNSSNRNGKNSRSLSPFRVSDLLFDPETSNHDINSKNPSPSTSFWYKKWKIKDLLLFRSASESRADDKKQQMKKYAQLKKTRPDDVKNSSFRSTDSGGGSVSSRRRSTAPISAHEMHYTINRAFSEEMRKRTSLPYRQGLLGCLGFNPTTGLNSSGSLSRG